MKRYLIYDGKYHSDPTTAMVMSICDNLKDAKKECGSGCVIEENVCKQKNGSICGNAWRTDYLEVTATGKTWG